MFASMGFASGDERWLEVAARHFEQTLAGTDVVGAVVDCGGSGLAGCGVIEFQRIPSPFNVTGTYAYISSMSTDVAWQRRGCARAALDELLHEARRREVRRVELHATPVGELLYRSVGFAERQGGTEMRLDLIEHD